MTGAELKVTLGALGLLPGWFANHMKVSKRTVIRWCDSDQIPEKFTEELARLCDGTVEMMLGMIADAGDLKSVLLYTYRTDEEYDSLWPASWHRQLTFRVMEHFRAEGRTVKVLYV